MAGLTVEHTYRYSFASTFSFDRENSDRAFLSLAADRSVPLLKSGQTLTAKPQTEADVSFFDGILLRPKRAAALLRGVSEIVTARFNNPNWFRLADPVITGGSGRLRFEGFSACCSTYVRADFLPNALEGRWGPRGTTNVDFNPEMLSALRSIREKDYVGFSVGHDSIALNRAGQKTVERKVALPVRWLKGFVEIQMYQSRMIPHIEVSGLEARNFLLSIPRAKSRTPIYIVPSGRGLRLSRIAGRGGVKAAGLERLRVLEAFVHEAESMRIYGDEKTGTSAWELVFPEARFQLLLSADVWRGFSGEGQILETLTENKHLENLDIVRQAFESLEEPDLGAISRQTGIAPDEVRTVLTALGTRGLVGYDLESSSWFHRVLPFDLKKIEDLQPRLINAKKLINENKVRFTKQKPNRIEAFVQSSDVEYFVRIEDGNSKCTCPWYAKYQNERGPCKHILAVQIMLDQMKKQD